MDEKRKYVRVSLSGPVYYEIDNKAKIKNVSEGGICMVTEKSLSYGNDLTIMFSLPEAIPLSVKSFAKVVWSKSCGENIYESGIQFWDISSLYLKRLQSFVRKHSKPVNAN